MTKRVSILGSTGSIGTQTLEVLAAFKDSFELVALAAGCNIDLLKEQIREFRPELVSVKDAEVVADLEAYVNDLGLSCEVVSGEPGLCKVATYGDIDLLVVAVMGTASLLPTVSAIKAGIDIGLACKEVLVAAGDLVMDLAKKHAVAMLPIDSEHAAIKQCLAGVTSISDDVSKLILTASGGPFRDRPASTFSDITVADALAHPNWEMGAKITIDSATLMNKGLEVIEAHHLFGVAFSNIEVVVHPGSIIHSMVEFTDGTILSQMGLPDMRFPIQYVLTYPEKWPNPWPKTDLPALGSLAFYPPDLEKFPALKLAYQAGETGGTAPLVLNAANEAAVALFLAEKISFLDITQMVAAAMDRYAASKATDIESIVALDLEVKASVTALGERVRH